MADLQKKKKSQGTRTPPPRAAKPAPTVQNVRELASSGKHAQATAALEKKLAQRTKELQAANALIEQRANELAVINSVQAALAAKLDMQGIYDAVGDKIREIFRRADVEIRIVDRQAGVWRFPYLTVRGERFSIAPQPAAFEMMASSDPIDPAASSMASMCRRASSRARRRCRSSSRFWRRPMS